MVIANGQMFIGSIAGTAGNGSNAGDADVTSFNLQTGVSTETLLHAALGQDDHDCPAFAVLPDGRILAEYATHGANNYVYWRIGTSSGGTTNWGSLALEQTSTVNTANDGNGNTYSNPFYLSTLNVPNLVLNGSGTAYFDLSAGEHGRRQRRERSGTRRRQSRAGRNPRRCTSTS